MVGVSSSEWRHRRREVVALHQPQGKRRQRDLETWLCELGEDWIGIWGFARRRF